MLLFRQPVSSVQLPKNKQTVWDVTVCLWQCFIYLFFASDLDASLIPIKMRAVWTDFSHHYLLGDLLVLVNGVDWGQFGFLIAEQLPHSLLIAIVGSSQYITHRPPKCLIKMLRGISWNARRRNRCSVFFIYFLFLVICVFIIGKVIVIIVNVSKRNGERSDSSNDFLKVEWGVIFE